jgi:hypothetical protein
MDVIAVGRCAKLSNCGSEATTLLDNTVVFLPQAIKPLLNATT